MLRAWRSGLGAQFHSLSIIQPVYALFPALSSSHVTDCWIGILLDTSSLFFPSSTSSLLFFLLPLYLSGMLCDTKEKRGRKGKKNRQIEAERGDGTQRNMRLLSKNTSLSVSPPSILMRVHKMQECTSHARIYTQTYALQGQPACVFASTHFHSH